MAAVQPPERTGAELEAGPPAGRRVALVGDAGYCPSPMSGQGTSLATENPGGPPSEESGERAKNAIELDG